MTRGINKKTGLPKKRPGPKSKLDDPTAVDYAVEKLALGFAQVRVAQAIGISESSMSEWLDKPDFRRKVESKRMELADGPLNKILNNNPALWLERTIPEFSPPVKSEVAAELVIRFEGFTTKPNGETETDRS